MREKREKEKIESEEESTTKRDQAKGSPPRPAEKKKIGIPG